MVTQTTETESIPELLQWLDERVEWVCWVRANLVRCNRDGLFRLDPYDIEVEELDKLLGAACAYVDSLEDWHWSLPNNADGFKYEARIQIGPGYDGRVYYARSNHSPAHAMLLALKQALEAVA